MIHRFFVSVDDVFWSNFVSAYNEHILISDYSQIIALVPKFETQSNHFSWRQQTLNCTIKQDGIIEYLYHLSDDTNHDSVLTLTILCNIIDKHRSDNCTGGLRRITPKEDINIVWFYGIPGHGRGLVGACPPSGANRFSEDMWFLFIYLFKIYFTSFFLISRAVKLTIYTERKSKIFTYDIRKYKWY